MNLVTLMMDRRVPSILFAACKMADSAHWLTKQGNTAFPARAAGDISGQRTTAGMLGGHARLAAFTMVRSALFLDLEGQDAGSATSASCFSLSVQLLLAAFLSADCILINVKAQDCGRSSACLLPALSLVARVRVSCSGLPCHAHAYPRLPKQVLPAQPFRAAGCSATAIWLGLCMILRMSSKAHLTTLLCRYTLAGSKLQAHLQLLDQSCSLPSATHPLMPLPRRPPSASTPSSQTWSKPSLSGRRRLQTASATCLR